MKKLHNSERWKAQSRRRQRSELRSSQRRRRWLQLKRGGLIGRPSPKTESRKGAREEKRVTAPETFSLIEAPEPTIAFLEELRTVAKRHPVFVDMESVQRLTPDAVAALVAVVEGDERRGSVKARGNQPRAEEAQRMLEVSGFDEHVKMRAAAPRLGKIRRDLQRSDRDADAAVAKDLVDFAHAGDARQPILKPSYGFLIECMTNTYQHAAPNSSGTTRWWATVYRDPAKRRASFTFIDYGVGILESAQLSRIRRMEKWVGLLDAGEILRRILLREIGSRTKLSYRGRGLHSMYQAWKNHRIERLVILANKGYAAADGDRYRELSLPFKGTLVYWEQSSEHAE